MAAREYVSANPQTDLEKADKKREKKELKDMPDIKLERLAEIYKKRRLQKATAWIVAKELYYHDILTTHVRDELGIIEFNQAKPIQAPFATGASFSVKRILSLVVTLFFPLETLAYFLYGFALFFLIILGVITAKTGGSSVRKAVTIVTFWGFVAMAMAALVGYLFNVISC